MNFTNSDMSAPLKRKRFTSNEQTLVSEMVTRKLWLKIPADETKDFLLYSYDRLITKHMEIGFNAGRLRDFTKRDLPSANIWRKTYVSGLHIGGRQGRTRRTVFMHRPSPPRANPGAFDFFEMFWSNSRYFASLDGQMPHPVELQRGSNPPPSMLYVNKDDRQKKEKLYLLYEYL